MTALPPPMGSAVYQRVRKAMLLAERAYPGPVGVLLAIELGAWLEIGHKFGAFKLTMGIVDDVLARAERGEAA